MTASLIHPGPASDVAVRPRPPLPFDAETAAAKVRAAKDAGNGRDPAAVARAYTPDTRWRNRAEHLRGREEVALFLTRKWTEERKYRLIKELWAFTEDRIAVRFAYENLRADRRWMRSWGNEMWLFAPDGRIRERHASISDAPIAEGDRLLRWSLGPRPAGHPGLSDLGL